VRLQARPAGALLAGLALLGFAAWALAVPAAAAASPDLIRRGEYLLHAGGCLSCHTDYKGGGKPLAGGRALKTPFGSFYSPNITADKATGIGSWSDQQFLAALKHGIRADGAELFPVLPFTSYTKMTDQDALAIKAYLFSLPPVVQANKPHQISPPFSWRWLQAGWKWLFFKAGDFQPDPRQSAAWNRGAYLATALAHCGECHTPRNWFGGLDQDMALAGTLDGPEGEKAPNITPDPDTGIGKWTREDLVALLKTGDKPDFDNVQGAMAEVIQHGLKFLSDEDLNAIATYILAQPPIRHKVARAP